MKTYKNLYPQISSLDNLYLAFRAARRGKRGRADVAEFEYHLEQNLLALKARLEEETYVPARYHNFHVYDPKPRLISAAPFRDRVVHHALCRVIEPLFEKGFLPESYACRKGKGTHSAIRRAKEFSGRFPYVLKCDIQHFFPRMDHQILYGQFKRRLADGQTLRLCKLILDSGAGIHADVPPAWLEGDDLFSALRPRGLPIGNLTSQFWANVYLDPLDHFIKRDLKCRGYVRYVDDFLLYARTKAELHEWRLAVIEHLAGLRLTLHESEAQVFPTQTGIPFLGWRIYPDHLRLRRRNGVAFQRRFVNLRRGFAQGLLTRQRLDAGVQGWIAHVSHGQTWGLRRSLLTRAIIQSYRQRSA